MTLEQRLSVELDIASVRERGVEDWLDTFVPLIREDEAQHLLLSVDDSFVEAASAFESGERAILWTGYKSAVEVGQLLHSRTEWNRAASLSKIQRYHPTSHIYALLDSMNDARIPEVPSQIAPIGFWQYQKALLKNLAAEMFRGRLPRGTFSSHGWWPGVMTWGYPNSFHLKYLRINGMERYHIIRPELWLHTGMTNGSPNHGLADSFSTRFIESLVDRIPDLGSFRGTAFRTYLENLVKKRISILSTLVNGMSQKIPEGQSTIIASSLGVPLMKCFSAASRLKGHRVVGFAHGNFGLIDMRQKSYNEMCVVDEYVTVDESSSRMFERIGDKYRIPGLQQCKISHIGARDSLIEMSEVDHHIGNGEILFLEFPLTPHRYRTARSYWNIQLYLQATLSRQFRSCGIRTTIKLHPDRLSESDDIYESFFDDQISTRFEKIKSGYSAYLFTDIGTTTFQYALDNNFPIIVCSHSLQDVWPDIRGLLKSRCTVLETCFDDAERPYIPKQQVERIAEVLKKQTGLSASVPGLTLL